MEWYNEPPRWEKVGAALNMTTGPETDFWRKTHYAFIRDNGHFYYEQVKGDFVALVAIRGRYTDLYDQAGLMVRVDEANWCKCGIEFVNGVQNASCVVTREYSDWSVVNLAASPSALWLRVTRTGTTLEVEYSLDSASYLLLRLAYLPMAETVMVGPVCASPQGRGFDVTFDDWSLKPR